MVQLASVQHRGRRKLVARLETETEGVVNYCDLTSVAPDARTFLSMGPSALRRAEDLIASASPNQLIPPNECTLLSPLDGALVGKFICIGMNYADHCHEQNCPIPETPVVFSKFGTSVIGPDDPIGVEGITTKLDYEVELGVVIGTKVPRRTKKEEAMEYVGGYTVVHDVSARDLQLDAGSNGGQWLLGKCCDGYAPLGPVLVTADEIPPSRVHDLAIKCRVNGETLQDSRTDQLVHKIDDLIAYLSKFVTLELGDVIATGTPPGVGCFRNPSRWLKAGDVVECEIEGIGTLSNPVVETVPDRPSEDESSPKEEEDPSSPPAAASIDVPAAASGGSSGGGKLAGANCIVTGGAGGIGRGIALRLGRDGASRVALVDFVSDSAIAAAAKELVEACPTCQYDAVKCDVTDVEAVTKAWGECAARGGGKLDVLVQSAGITGETNVKCQDVNPDDFDRVFKVNVRGTFNGCKAALPYMVANQYGRIVNVASISGKEGNAGMSAYSSSKAAVIGLTKVIGKEYATEGDITVNAVAPAVVRTQMVDNMPVEQVKYMTDKIPMKRCGTIEEIAGLVAFIVGPEASFTTGFCFDATGGRAVY